MIALIDPVGAIKAISDFGQFPYDNKSKIPHVSFITIKTFEIIFRKSLQCLKTRSF